MGKNLDLKIKKTECRRGVENFKNLKSVKNNFNPSQYVVKYFSKMTINC